MSRNVGFSFFSFFCTVAEMHDKVFFLFLFLLTETSVYRISAQRKNQPFTYIMIIISLLFFVLFYFSPGAD